MDYEKKYKEVLERAKTLYENANGLILKKWVEQIFPELAESEDERIRKEIIEFVTIVADSKSNKMEWIAWLEKQGKEECTLKSSKDEDVRKFMEYIEKEAKAYDFNLPNRSYDIYAFAKDILVWLKKQGEQKSIFDFNANNWYVSKVDGKIHNLYNSGVEPKFEPKFKVGDWIAYNHNPNLPPRKIIQITNEHYVFNNGSCEIKTLEADWHLWTIQDAKDGDVLAADECYVIFKEIDGLNIKCYCTYHYMGFNPIFHIDTLQNKTAFKPATKEQRNTLFAAMKAEGYEWDAEKKELKKIEWNDIVRDSIFDEGIDIPFGAIDSELYYQEINIPDGFQATIEDRKIILKREE